MIVVLVSVMLPLFVIWAAYAELEEVTRGSGRVIPTSRTQLIQSADPGVVREILVRLGQRVAKGDLLLRLDDTPSGSRVGEVEAQSRALRAQIARLITEVSDASGKAFMCPLELAEAAPAICDSEKALLAIRRENLEKRIAVLRQRLEQKVREFAETKSNIVRLNDSFNLAERELAMVRPMAQRNLVSQTELFRVERQMVELRGQIAVTTEGLARVDAARKEAELQIDEQFLLFQRDASAELTTKRSELSVLLETLRGAEERVRRTDIRSPVDGIVNALAVNTIGAFVNAGEKVLEVVPVEDKLLVEVRVRPADIAFIGANQKALVKVTAYDFSKYGGLDGIVEQVSADSIFDPNLKEPFYAVFVKTALSQLKYDKEILTIIPGMICDVDIITGRKSILSYIMKPITRARHEALRER